MVKNIYAILIGMIGLLVLLAGCQDNQLLNTTDSIDISNNALTASETVGETTVGVAGVFIDPISNLQLSAAQLTEGYPFYVTGYVGYLTSTTNPKNPNLTELHLEVNKDNEGWSTINIWDDSNIDSEQLTGRSNKPGREFDDTEFGTDFNKWTINATGSYVIRVTAEFTGPFDDADDTSEIVEVTLLTLDVEFPAAPAIAARILEANDVNARYGSGRTGGNYISDVAQYMGPGTEFNGVPKELWEDGEKVMNKAYWDAVWDYLEGYEYPYDLDLPNKPEGYIW